MRTQEEVIRHFWERFQQHGETYSKSATAYVRKGIKGETIVTTIYGKEETRYTIDDDDTCVVMGKAASECYCQSSKEFQENYITENPMEPKDSTIRDMGFSEYKSRRQIQALEVTAEDMKFFGEGGNGEAQFMAPWGSPTLVEEKDILATTFPLDDAKPEVYRIELSVFKQTYEQRQA